MNLKQQLASLSLALGLVSAMAAPSHAFFGLFGGDPDVDKAKKQSVSLLRKTYAGTIYLMQSASDLYLAAGKKAEAEKTLSIVSQLKGANQSDPQGLKQVSSDLDGTLKSLNTEMKFADKLTAEQQTSLFAGMLNIGVAGLCDGLAVKDATDLTQSTTKLIQGASSNPTKLMGLKDVAETAGYVTSFVPPQASSIQSISASLQKYASSHGLPMPSTDDIKKAMESAVKE